MNYKSVVKTLLFVAGGAVVNYLITIIPGVHISATLDPVITGVGTVLLHAAQEYFATNTPPAGQ